MYFVYSYKCVSMYRKIIFPTEKEHSVELPSDLYGMKVEVIAFPIEEEVTMASTPVVDVDKFYDSIKLDFSGFKFNRDEANER